MRRNVNRKVYSDRNNVSATPYHGQFGSCGLDNNTALDIVLLGNLEQYTALCEVLVYGVGEVWGVYKA